MTDLIALARACGADVYPNEIDFTPAQLAAFAARIAPPEAKTIDIERMLRECVPGGSVCDPQRVADDIREWFAAPPAAGAPDAMALLADYLESQEFHERCMDYRGATIAYVPAAFELLQESIEGAARKVLAAPAAPAVPTEALRKALELAVRQNSHDMLMTGEEIRKCEAALAPEQAAPVQAVPEGMAVLRSALERLAWSYELLLSRKPQALENAGTLLSNWAFNMAQRCAHTLTSDDCAELDKMRKRWDAAYRATPASGEGERNGCR